MIKRLPGYKKHHFVPEGYSAAAQNFVRTIGAERVKATADDLCLALREHYELKRRELSYHEEDGFAEIETPHFQVEVSIDQDLEDAAAYLETVQVARFSAFETITDPRFIHCLNPHCDEVLFEFPQGIVVEDKIDAIEEIDALLHFLNYPPDASSMELKIPEIDLRIGFTAAQASFKLCGMRDLGRLVESTRKTLELLAPAGFPEMTFLE